MLRAWASGMVCGSLLLPACPALTQELRDVRMADHARFTRLVFELDTPVDYGLEREQAGRVLLVRVDARGEAKTLRSWGPWVKRATVEPLLDITQIRVELRSSGVTVREERLEAPPRIVLDVGAPAAASPTVSEASIAPAPLAELPPSVAPTSPVVASPAAAPRANAPHALRPLPAARNDSAALSKTLPPDVDPERVHDPRAIATQLSDAERMPIPASRPTGNRSDSLLGYGVFIALLLVAALFGIFASRSRRARQRARRAEIAERVLSQRGGRAQSSPAEPSQPVGREVPVQPAPTRDDAPSPTPEPLSLDPPVDVPSTPAGRPQEPDVDRGDAGEIDPRVEALQLRVDALEFALERALEGRERLDAQLVAQAEELRVQRAAIARTQRALRALAQGRGSGHDEEALRG
ncbi:MAG: hypothetical protein VCB99_01980 [Myxococcota bacterium]